MNERGGILRKLLIAGVLGWGVWFAYQHGGVDFNLKRLGGELEQQVNQVLSRQNLTDSDILAQVRVEHRQWGLSWIESRRTLAVASERRQEDIADALGGVARKHLCFYSKTNEADGLLVAIRFGPFVLQSVRLTAASARRAPVTAKRHMAAIVVDDVAYETASMDRFASLGIPLTFAILPRDKHSKELSAKARKLGFAVMLHLPMEPQDLTHNDPGPSALLLKMTDQELRHHFDQNVASVPNIVGINNHMGSAFTEHEGKMSLVLQWVKERKLYFLDSHTSGKSVVGKVCRKLRLPYLTNETFLDNVDEQKAIEHQLDLVMALAEKRSQTVAIGHYRRKFLVQALQQKIPEFRARNIDFVTVPRLLQK